ncbi:fimbria/pilus outer membrane usher protein [Ramlibacter sp. PS3R-8]|uniref:fimbria/pilus outer membrane usher protein n=1 Tax=Ramlibacter sp. PS3R-8 TaxID=3133437 RepID=UPI0030AF8454
MSIPRAASERPSGGHRPRPAIPFPPAAARRGTSAAACLVAIALGCGAAPAAQAQSRPPAAQGDAAQPEHAILTLRTNGVERGEFTVLRIADGDFWIAAADLPKLQIAPREQALRQHGGETWYSARRLGATSVRFDEGDLRLVIDFRADALAGTQVDLSNQPPPVPVSDAVNSLVLSYRLGVEKPSVGPTQVAADTDLNVRVAGILLRQEMRFDSAPDRKRATRGATQAIWDDRKNARRYIAGDVVSSAGPYGSTITGAGAMVAKVYDLAPDLVRQPTANIHASTTLPADVEVQVDGTTIYRGRVGPGPISLDNLLLSGGTRTVRVVVTDTSGRQQIIEQPFLFADTVLAKGFHEYNYFAGKRSDITETNTFVYRESAWQAYHRYGVSDDVTVSAGGEGNSNFYNLGAGITLRSDRAGLLALDLMRNTGRAADSGASGWSVRYTYQAPLGSLVLGRREFGERFHSFASALDNPFPRRETRVGVATSLGNLNLSADLVRTVRALATQDNRFVRVSTNLSRNLSVFAEYQTTRINGFNGTAFNIYLRADLENDRWVSTSVQTQAGGRRDFEVQAGQQLPAGEGFGYRVGATTSSGSAESSTRSSFVAADWNLRPASVSMFAQSPLGGHGGTYVLGQVSGALVALDGYWGMTRQVTDGFALVKLGVPQENVEILLNNQPQGRTDPLGRLFLPQVGSFGRQDITINDKELGMQYTMTERKRTIAPSYRSGTVVDFGVRKVNAVAGMAWQMVAGARKPIASRAWTMAGDAGSVNIETGSAGDFYLENAEPGVYTGTLRIQDRSYVCRMTVPAFPEPVHELKEGLACE